MLLQAGKQLIRPVGRFSIFEQDIDTIVRYLVRIKRETPSGQRIEKTMQVLTDLTHSNPSASSIAVAFLWKALPKVFRMISGKGAGTLGICSLPE
jgi:hypothetical protein